MFTELTVRVCIDVQGFMWAQGASVRRAWQDLQGVERVYRGFFAFTQVCVFHRFAAVVLKQCF